MEEEEEDKRRMHVSWNPVGGWNRCGAHCAKMSVAGL